MIPVSCSSTVPIPPPAYRRAQAKARPALHLDALTLVTRLHLLALCRLAVRLAHRRCPPPLPAGPGGHPRVYSEASLVLIALLRTLWRLSYQDMCDWLRSWPTLALACGLPLDARGQPRIPSASQQWKRERAAGAPVGEALLILAVQTALRCRLIGARDLIIDSAPILAWRRRDPDAQVGHAPAHHPRAHSCVAIASIPCSAEAPVSRCSFSCLPRTYMMPPLPNLCLPGRFCSISCAPASSAWMPGIGDCA